MTESKKKVKQNETQEVQNDLLNEIENNNEILAEKEKFKDLYLRTLADFENYKRRNKDAIDKATMDGIVYSAKALLSSYDAIEKAVTITEGKIKEGLEQIKHTILENFNNLGIEEIECKGMDFNPNFHNGVVVVENDELDGKVVDEFQKGFKFGNTIVRYSTVSVGKKKE